MESPEDIEKALSRLMPAALSEDGKRSIEELIDGLAATGKVVELPRKSGWPWAGGIAAAAAAVVLALNLPGTDSAGPATGPVAEESFEEEGIVLIRQTERVADAEPEGWLSETDGVAHRAWRVRVIDEDHVRDVKTGYEVTVSRPREEVILMPVTSF